MSLYTEHSETSMPPAVPSLVMFQHCDKVIYSSSVPQHCPICGQQSVTSWDLEKSPVTLPCPFTNAHSQTCAFVLKPTIGQFIGGYDGCSDLHVGITSSKGTVHHYNETGIHKDSSGWEQCVSVELVPPDQHALIHQWDAYLETFSFDDRWLLQRYNEQNHNCYTFALTFINTLLQLEGKRTFSKEEFTGRFVLPKTRQASKYITLCHQVSRNNYYITDHHTG
ncbi:MKRN2 opposite strand protein [Hyperolius riggenbachi]|uniref:MKRN2 opposite strand protein n=1 Tax=Hyperolius riggenbachi TaxID=752182 RepID=UPI0035A3C7B3